MMNDNGQEEWQRGPGDPKQEKGGGGVKLKGDKNRKGRSKNIQEYQERWGGGGGGGILKLNRD